MCWASRIACSSEGDAGEMPNCIGTIQPVTSAAKSESGYESLQEINVDKSHDIICTTVAHMQHSD